ncbi:orotate phosphoribosyltransferase [Limosilactobacillus fastidiosus]|uniref:Orotate phosphoribosyltransferase n=1 Tax=Limosilactobacillus fastidiosus TaxID=2759855 RepID=A0A7W3TYI0_9LACO|nr:orotate phosphoribosyltransferase [Limosilactobacillus fastidiosus]MBB1062423.1 orotate phosphoribosyltransferase [Limosilactobacillus fastidiosus]MBB1085626.1 orotate phosphoribosyltransferase [Limosilactobacillus fastidiosus]MCD7083497.1 orotate phosphoribosyltransferase [Limosilactobacillus fastidiosus]MCD7086079.1 orotate phosphoribosyltransferase [Limosilactobacillus fastidiosus]MCD7114277.1 orotate phosphoribosyltransferase [Limosilactobacillus fastidiosus]
MTYSQRVAQVLLNINAVTLNPEKPFTWASGMKSPIYTDNRLTISFPDVRQAIVNGMAEQIKLHFNEAEAIAGTATAGIPHATGVAQQMGLPMVYVRTKPKDHGEGKQVEGILRPGEKVVVIDDLISTGGSVLNAVHAIESEGAEVIGVVSIFTYQLQAAEQNFMVNGLQYYSVTNYSTLVNLAKENGLINTDHLKSLQEWRKDPMKWSNQHGLLAL